MIIGSGLIGGAPKLRPMEGIGDEEGYPTTDHPPHLLTL